MKLYPRRKILKALCLLPVAPVIANVADVNYVDQALSRMSLDDKVGMLLMVPLKEAMLESFLRDYKCGSLLVWGGITQIKYITELCALANRAQTLSQKYRSLPVWLHGYAPGLSWTPEWVSKAVNNNATTEEVRKAAAIFGRRWRAVGLHNLPQPCLNVPMYNTGIMQSWAISKDPDVVLRYGLALTQGVLSARCGTMAQHFPAHGATPLDSHNAFPVVDLPMEELWKNHLDCYQECFDAGCTTLCTAHLACLAIDPDPNQIATTSRKILTDFLRGKMHFRGICIADALEMRGFQKNGPLEQVAVEAVNAGCDSLCLSETKDVEPVFTNLLQAAKQGKIPPERLDEAVKRNLDFMGWLGLFKNAIVETNTALKMMDNEEDNKFLKTMNNEQ